VWLIVGLGNPGQKYAKNRHNAGFMVLDELARRHDLGSYRAKFGGEYASGQVVSHRAHLLKPMEFMNNSGFAVSRALSFLSVPTTSTVVVHDEADIEFGRIKLKRDGGHGGHNGLRSLIEQLGVDDFMRVRIGVGKPEGTAGKGPGDKRVANYLLSDFPDDKARDELIGRGADAVELILEKGLEEAMQRVHTLPPG
jgi:PTH1 family peptidyl-tRNA hydrolase